MTVFVDTSGFYAVFDQSDENHSIARKGWESLLRAGETLLTNNYVLLESSALLQHRLGIAAVRALYSDVMPVLEVDWVTAEQHRAGVEAVLASGRKKLSLVDCVSFQTMRTRSVRKALCFDTHFRDQGFVIEP